MIGVRAIEFWDDYTYYPARPQDGSYFTAIRLMQSSTVYPVGVNLAIL